MQVTREVLERAQQEFTEYFVKNYPGPDTIIHNPNWHAPKIFRAAVSAINSVHVAKPLAESAVASHECGSVPDGWKLVPIEPTQEMRIAGFHSNAIKSWPDGEYHHHGASDAYRAMIAAAPVQPRATVEQEAIAKPDSVHLAEPTETATDTRLDAVVRASFMKSKLFKMFTEQSLWHANYVNLQWRYNGGYVHEEADWIKDIWYAMRGQNPGEQNAQSGMTLPKTTGQPNEQNAVAIDAFVRTDGVVGHHPDYGQGVYTHPPVVLSDVQLKYVQECIERAKLLPVWDGLPSSLHAELDNIFRGVALLAQRQPSLSDHNLMANARVAKSLGMKRITASISVDAILAQRQDSDKDATK